MRAGRLVVYASLLIVSVYGVPASVMPLIGSASAAPQPGNAVVGPQEFMDGISKRMFAALDGNRAAITKDPQKVYPLVDQILLPHFDIEYASQLVLAQHWRDASPDQRKRFIDAFYKALLHTYGNALTDFTADRLKKLPFRGDATANRATVRTEVTRSSGAVVPVDYVMRKTDTGEWKAFDVVIEGISYVRNYRTDLGAEADQRGLDAVILRLEREGLKIKASDAR